MANSKAIYRDMDISFSTHPITGDLAMKSDIPAVIQSVRSLLLTVPGEILWEPNIGGGVGRLMFEPNDTMLRMQLYDKITNTINRFETRIELTKLDIQTFENGYGIYVGLTFYMLNSPEPITETVSIKRLR